MVPPFARLQRFLPLAGLLALTGCAATLPPPTPRPPQPVTVRPKQPCKCEIARVLDRFHAAAARADEPAYFAAFAPGGVFLGTDASERWSVAAFRAYAHPHFASGKGWKYVPRQREISFSQDGSVAWFDELLDHEKYGELRGSGVLVKREQAWQIAQYNLTFTVPNAVASDMLKLRQEAAAGR